ncbi:MAG: 2-hydroxyacid dehydrogenase [Bacillales bacterium]|jgi:D-lactate dehydrogenase|nr:2-hydroxyacid dehydrogenase [Bacillales bacterium]
MSYKILVYDTKPYDKEYFELLKDERFNIKYLDAKLDNQTAYLAKGYDAICIFVNEYVDKEIIDILLSFNIKLIALRSAGFNNVDLKYAFNKIHIVRVPAYSPYAVAEYAMALLLTLNRKTNKSYIRVREHNFSLIGLTGFDLKNKTIGVIGTGKIGRIFIDICLGFGCKVLAYDLFPYQDDRITFTTLEHLYKDSDIISLHIPLSKETQHLINKNSMALMKDGVYIINTSRGALVNSLDLLNNLKSKKIGGVALDVYEEEANLFFEDLSYEIIDDEIITQLISLPNTLITSHQAFLTKEALTNIVKTTLDNVIEFFEKDTLVNEVCYQCSKKGNCAKKGRCF